MLILEKIQRKLFLLIFLVAVALVGCDDPDLSVLDQVVSEAQPPVSSYTGELHRVGNVEKFGRNVESPDALEWNGESLYMLADRGRYTNKGQYLFKVDRETGEALMINPGAKDLGGSFSQGQVFTQVLYVSPSDMTWHPDGQMFAVCPVLDSIVTIDLETGLAGRITFDKDFCLRYPEGDSEFDHEFGGYPVIGAGRALAWTDQGIYMWGISLRSTDIVDRGYRSFGALYEISDNLKCATPVGSPVFFGQPTEGPPYPDEGEAYAYSFCFDGEHLYMSGADTSALYVIDVDTGALTFVADWHFSEPPPGYALHELGIHDLEADVLGGIWITGLAFDGQDMFAVCSFTDGLYIVE